MPRKPERPRSVVPEEARAGAVIFQIVQGVSVVIVKRVAGIRAQPIKSNVPCGCGTNNAQPSAPVEAGAILAKAEHGSVHPK